LGMNVFAIFLISSVYLKQLQVEGYSIFVVRGQLPPSELDTGSCDAI
jgi:hypothetical protein